MRFPEFKDRTERESFSVVSKRCTAHINKPLNLVFFIYLFFVIKCGVSIGCEIWLYMTVLKNVGLVFGPSVFRLQ